MLTDALDLAGALLLILAVAVLVWPWSVALALASAGVLVLLLSYLIGAAVNIPREAVVAYDDYVGPGYSLPTAAMAEAVTLLARTESILLDPVYSGKAMSGLIDLVRKGVLPAGSNVLFLHTGGSPALYAYEETFRKSWA